MTKKKHKHKWQFAELSSPYVYQTKTGFIKDQYITFICECGKLKEVKVK
jgi:hypothetical protein